VTRINFLHLDFFMTIILISFQAIGPFYCRHKSRLKGNLKLELNWGNLHRWKVNMMNDLSKFWNKSKGNNIFHNVFSSHFTCVHVLLNFSSQILNNIKARRSWKSFKIKSTFRKYSSVFLRSFLAFFIHKCSSAFFISPKRKKP